MVGRFQIRGRKGFALAETLVALFLLGVALLMAAAIGSWASREAGRAVQRGLALDLATAVTEELRVTPFGSIEEGPWPLPRLVDQALPDVAIQLLVEQDEELALKYVDVEVTWTGRTAGTLTLATAVGSVPVYP